MTVKPYGEKRKQKITMTLNPDVIDRMKDMAKLEGVSVSHVANRLLEEYSVGGRGA